MSYTIDDATPDDFAAIADVNVRAYEEFAFPLPPGTWDRPQACLADIATRSRRERFILSLRGDDGGSG